MLSGKNILFGITGGIAAYKCTQAIRLLVKQGANVRVVMTESATQFVTPITLSVLSKKPVLIKLTSPSGEWNNHVDLALWADVFLIAPVTANTLAKIATGVCDNLLLATYFSAKCPVYIAPAMDLDMYLHPTVKKNIVTIESFGNQIIPPTSGELASGLVGEGRMEEPEMLVEVIANHFQKSSLLKGKNILITAGPTYEQIDPVRFIGNNSSGKMGVEIAEKAAQLGANVTLIIGPSSVPSSPKIQRINTISAENMYDMVHEYTEKSDVIIMSAAVADYTPKTTANSKLKKKTDTLQIDLIPTKDILKSVGEIKKEEQILVGFALETDNEIENAKAKCIRKKLDFIVLNSLKDAGAGFGGETNKVTFIDKEGIIEQFELKSKAKVAADILVKVEKLV